MDWDKFDKLNEIYGQINEKAAAIKKVLTEADFSVTSGFFNNHYIKRGKDFAVENYPIKILSVANVGEIGIDIDSVWLEIKLSKEKALAVEFLKFSDYNMEIYGADGYLDDFYNEEKDLKTVAESIANSNETHICVNFTFGAEICCKEIIKLIKSF